MKRVLVTGATNIGKAGVATIVYKWGQAFDSNKIVYDYLMQRGLPDTMYQKAIKDKGGIMYTRSVEGHKDFLGIIKWVSQVVKDNHYETIHINSDSAYLAAAYIFAAKKGGIKHIFVHSHCTQIDDNSSLKRTIKAILHKIFMPYVRKNTKYYLACSKLAGVWMFGKKCVDGPRYKTIYNGVEVEKYLFDSEVRVEMRKSLGVKGEKIIGNIGRLSYQKNQDFLLDVFYDYNKKNPESKLFIVGEGELETSLKEKVRTLGLNDKVRFLGLRNDVPALLSAFDVMVMPSRFEGLPVTMVEAQMADLPCVVSANITKEADFTGIVKYVDNYDAKDWIDGIDSFANYKRAGHREERMDSKFNAVNAADELADILTLEQR